MVDCSCAANVVMGSGVFLFALRDLNWEFNGLRLSLFLIVMLCGLAISYGFLLLLTSLSVWFMRNQSLMEMWWLFGTLMRYPREIFRGPLATPVGYIFSFAIPIILVTNVPATVMVKVLDWRLAVYMAMATV